MRRTRRGPRRGRRRGGRRASAERTIARCGPRRDARRPPRAASRSGSAPRSGSSGPTGRRSARPSSRPRPAGADDLWIDDHLLVRRGRSRRPEARGLGDAGGAWPRSRAGPARAARGREHVPEPRPDRQARDRPSTTSAAGGRSSASAAAGSRTSIGRSGSSSGAGSASASTGSRRPSPLIRRLLDGERVSHDGRFYTSATPSRPRAGPATPPDPDRRLRPDEDPAARRPPRRPVERLRLAGERSPRATRSSASNARRSAATRRDRADGQPQRRRPIGRGRGASASGRAYVATTSRAKARAGSLVGGPVEEVAEALAEVRARSASATRS